MGKEEVEQQGEMTPDFNDVEVLQRAEEYSEGESQICGRDIWYVSYLCKYREQERYEVREYMRTSCTEGIQHVRSYFVPASFVPQLSNSSRKSIAAAEPAITQDNRSGVSSSIDALMHKTRTLNLPFSSDLRNDLQELKQCLMRSCFRAALALCGRILEASLKIVLLKADISFDDNWMVGRLLKELDDKDLYCDPALKNYYNIVNQQRIIGVHVRESVPIPSENQVLSVTYIVCDCVERCLSE